jgi:ABC-2 type transport system permease protein
MNGPLMTVAWLTWRQLTARRRAWLAAAAILLPFILTFFYRLASEDREGDRLIFMLGMNRDIIIGVLVPLTAVIFGTTAFGGEVDDGTLIYLLVQPLPRWRVALTKYAIAVLITAAINTAAILLAWFAMRNGELPAAIPRAFIAAALVGSILYCALFSYVGLATRKGLVLGLLYIIFFENVLTRGLAGVKWLSVREFGVSVAQWAGGGVVKFTDASVPMTTVWVAGSIILVAALAMTIRTMMRYELAERL